MKKYIPFISFVLFLTHFQVQTLIAAPSSYLPLNQSIQKIEKTKDTVYLISGLIKIGHVTFWDNQIEIRKNKNSVLFSVHNVRSIHKIHFQNGSQKLFKPMLPPVKESSKKEIKIKEGPKESEAEKLARRNDSINQLTVVALFGTALAAGVYAILKKIFKEIKHDIDNFTWDH